MTRELAKGTEVERWYNMVLVKSRMIETWCSWWNAMSLRLRTSLGAILYSWLKTTTPRSRKHIHRQADLMCWCSMVPLSLFLYS